MNTKSKKQTLPTLLSICCQLVIALAMLFCGGTARGGDGTWNVPGDGLWNDPASWSGAVPNGIGDTAEFGTQYPATDTVVDLADLGATIGTLTDSNPNNVQIVGTGPLTLDLPSSGDAAVIRLNEGAGSLDILAPVILSDNGLAADILGEGSTLRIDGVISGAGGIRLDDGILDLRAANTFSGLLRVDGGEANIRGYSAHGGTQVAAGGRLLVRKIGSLVDAGQVTVDPGGLLRIVKPAGTDPTQNSVAPGAVVLNGGTVILAKNDFDPTGLLAPAGTGGVLALESLPTFTAGGSNVLDFEAIGGTGVRLGAETDTIIPSSVSLIPASADDTFRFGGAPGTLTIHAPIVDVPGHATSIEQAGGGTTVLWAANAYAGTTTVRDGTLVAAHSQALGESADVVVEPSGTLSIVSGTTIAVGHVRLAGGRLRGGSRGGALASTLNGAVEIAADSILTNESYSGALRLNGELSGAGGILVDQGVVDLRGANTFAGLLRVTDSEVQIHAPSAHGGSLVETGGRLVVDPAGSLVDAEQVTVHGGGRLRISRPAGTNPAQNSVAPGSVVLDRGEVTLADNDFDPANLFSPASTSGLLALSNIPTFTAGGSNVLDFDTMGGTAIRLAARTDSTIPAEVSLAPDQTTHTLRFGGAPSTLTIDAPIVDLGGAPTNVEQSIEGTTVLAGANTYTGTTTVNGGTVQVDHETALGSPMTGTIVDGGILKLNVPAAEPISVVNSSVIVTAAELTGPITMSGGSLVGDPSSGSSTLHGPLELSGATTATVTSRSGKKLAFRGGVSGTGNLQLEAEGTINFGAVGLSHDGDLDIHGDGTVNLNTSGTYTGHTVVRDTTLNVKAPRGLGAASSGTTIDNSTVNINAVTAEPLVLSSGTLNINAAGSSPIVQEGGTVYLNDATTAHTGTYSMKGGILTTNVADGSGAILAGLLTATGETLTFSVSNNRTLTLDGGISGTGNLEFIPFRSDSTITVHGLVNVAGNLTVPYFADGTWVYGTVNFPAVTVTGNIDALNSSAAHFNGTLNCAGNLSIGTPDQGGYNTPWTTTLSGSGNSVSGSVRIAGNGSLVVDGATTIGDLAFDRGIPALYGTADLTVVDPTIQILQNRTIDFSTGGIVGDNAIVKTAPMTASIKNIGSTFHGTFHIEQGDLNVTGGNGLGSGVVHVAPTNAALVIDTVEPITNMVYLHNSTGFAYAGGLRTNTSRATFAGNLDLGDVGSYIGGVINISGAVSGGDLQLGYNWYQGETDVSLTGNANTYVGRTVLTGSNGNRAYLTLKDNGGLATTSQIILNAGARFQISNRHSNAGDRIADHIPITMNGGWIALQGFDTPDTTTTETLGPVTLNSGSSAIHVRPGARGESPGNATHLALTSLERRPGATVNFEGDGFYGALGGPDPREARLFILDQPTTDFLGGAFTVSRREGVDFAKYDPARGVRGLDPSDYDTGAESGWGPTTNAFVDLEWGDRVTLTDSRTVNSLKLRDGSVYLGGNTLNIVSGGVLPTGSGKIYGGAGGRLTAGGLATTGELIIHSSVEVFANITDNAGPDGLYDPVWGGPLDADNGGVGLTIWGGSAVWLYGNNTYSGMTTVNGAGVRIKNPEAVGRGGLTINGGSYRIDGDYTVELGDVVVHSGRIEDWGNAQFKLSSLVLEEGDVDGPILGDPPILKTGNAIASVGTDSQFGGTITIDGGMLFVGQDGLGRGATVNPGGMLSTYSNRVNGYIDLNGGTLGAGLSGFHKTITFTGSMPGQPSRIRVLADSTIQTFDATAKSNPAGFHVVIGGHLYLADGVALTKTGMGKLQIDGDLSVGADTSIVFDSGIGTVERNAIRGAIVADAPEASLNIVGSSTVDLNESIKVAEGQTLVVNADGSPVPLSIDGAGKSVTGGGTLVNDLTLSDGAVLRPGASPGRFTDRGSVTWGAGGIYVWEINDAIGTPGATDGNGWDLLDVAGTLELTATETNRFIIRLIGRDTHGGRGAVAHFDPHMNDEWLIAAADSINGFDMNRIEIDPSIFLEHNPIAKAASFTVQQIGGDLLLTYTAPEPATLALLVFGIAFLGWSVPPARDRGAG